MSNRLPLTHSWTRAQYLRFFPQTPEKIYRALAEAGFSGASYRNAWPDLLAALPSEQWSAPHFVEYLEAEVKTPRRFPISLDFDGLAKLSKLTVLRRQWHASLVRNVVQAHIDQSPECIEQSDFWSAVLPILAQFGTPLVVCGDSHSRVFRQTVSHRNRLCVPINILCGGGSAVGLPNPESRSGYGRRLATAMQAINTGNGGASPVRIGFKFGQVDLEFVHTYRRIKRGELIPNQQGFEDFCCEIIDAYVRWLGALPASDVWVLGVNPPCISDEHVHAAYVVQAQVYVGGGIAETSSEDSVETLTPALRSLQLPDKPARTANHRLFNQRLRMASQRAGLSYLDNFECFLGPDGCIAPKFACARAGDGLQIGADGQDIHVGGEFAMALEADLIRSLAFSPAQGSADLIAASSCA